MSGPFPMRYTLSVRVNIRPEAGPQYSNGLEVNEEISIEAEGFLGVCQVLAKFHELAQVLKVAKK